MLPGHQLPFHGLHTRSDELIAHHETRCAAIADACRAAPQSAAELVPVLFTRALDPHQMSFAFSEVQAHVNYMLRKGELAWMEGADDIERVDCALGDAMATPISQISTLACRTVIWVPAIMPEACLRHDAGMTFATDL